MSEVESLQFEGLVLEDQLLDHLATPEGATAIYKERLLPEVIEDDEEGIREALRFVLDYMDKHREPPTVSIISEETGYDEFNVPVAPVAYVIDKLRDRYQRKGLRAITTKIARLSNDPEGALSYGLAEFSRLKMETAPRGNAVTSENMFGTIDDYRIRVQSGASFGVTYGYEALDTHLGGLHIGEVVVLLARPKRYKSWQLLKSAHDAVLAGVNVDFCTMEMSETEMRDRFMCMASEIPWNRFKSEMLSEEDEERLEQTASDLRIHSEQALIRFHRPKPGDRNVHYVTEMAKEREAEVLYIDQLSWFDGAKDERSWAIIGKIMEQLKDTAQMFPVYMAAQYNRAAMLENGIADIASIGLADFIGQTADTLIGMFANKDMHKQGILHMGIVESRSYEQESWEIKVELNKNSNFRLLNTLQPA